MLIWGKAHAFKTAQAGEERSIDGVLRWQTGVMLRGMASEPCVAKVQRWAGKFKQKSRSPCGHRLS